MPLFGKRKSKLQTAISEAAADEKAYGKLYYTFSKQDDAAQDALKFVIDTVVSPPKEPTKLRSRLIPHGSRQSIHGSNSQLNINETIDGDIVRAIAYLTTLHGIVWSFPRDMAVVLRDPESSIVLLGVISAVNVPILVRETLLCMVSNWCILFREYLSARLNLESIVDTAKAKFGLRPNGYLLPDPPFTRGQENWPYPSMQQDAPAAQSLSKGKQKKTRSESAQVQKSDSSQTHSSANSAYRERQQQKQQQQHQNIQQNQYGQSQTFASAPSMPQYQEPPYPQQHQTTKQSKTQHKQKPNALSRQDTPAATQKRSFISSLLSSPQPSQRPALPSTPRPSQQETPQQQQQQQSYFQTPPHPQYQLPPLPSTTSHSESKLTPEFIVHMDTSVQELRSICDMLTENLISLNIEEDPSTNSVVQDMCGEIKRRKASVFNFINILGSESEVMMMKLTDVVDRADKCIWLYDKTLSAHEEWKAIQESLKTSAAEEARMNALEGTVRSIGSTRSFANLSGELHAESSKATAMLLAAAGSPAHMASSAATAAGVSSLSNVISEPLKSASVEVSDYTPGNSGSPVSYTTAAGSRAPLSSKARGKMAEDPSNPVTNSDDWDYHRDDSAYGGSTESAKLDTHYH